HRRQQIPRDPFPDRSQRATLYPTDVFMLGSTLDQQRLQRREKVLRGIIDAMLRRSILAEFRAQRGQEIGGTGEIAITAFQPLEFSQKIAPRERCQSLQKLVNSIGRHRCNLVFRDPKATSALPWGRLKVVAIK